MTGNDRRYTFKLYPTAEQRVELLRQCSMVADLWNALLHMQEEAYRRTQAQRGVVHSDGKPRLSEYDMGYLVTEMREACPEWQALSTWTPRRVCTALDAAFKAFFRRAKQGAGKSSGYPRFKSYRRGQHNWIPHRFASGCQLSHVKGNTWSLYLKGVEERIHARGRLPVEPIKWTHADIRVKSGVWWLSVGVEVARTRVGGDCPITVKVGGIGKVADVNGVAVSAGTIGLIDRESHKIEQLQKQLSDLSRDSELRPILRERKARLEARAARRRREVLHEWSTALIGRASEIVLIVPESVQESTASGHGNQKEWGAAVEFKASFNRTILDGAPAMLAQMIRYKAEEAGVPLSEAAHDDLSEGNAVVKATKANRRTARSAKHERDFIERDQEIRAGTGTHL